MTISECDCKMFRPTKCFKCAIDLSAIDRAMLRAYALILEQMKDETKLNSDELSIVKYCADRDIHPC